MKSTLVLFLAAVISSVCARSRLAAYMKAAARGPNVCAVQEVLRTGEQFFPYCMKRRIHRICGQQTFVRFQCCSGYERLEGEPGCSAEKPLNNLMDTAESLRLTTFTRYIERTGLRDQLENAGPYTVFAPSNAAFKQLPHQGRREFVPPRNSNEQTLLQYHMVPGLHNFTKIPRNDEVLTLYEDKKIRLNKYPNGLATVNCARISLPNQQATNGIIHVIKKPLKPLDSVGNVAEVLRNDGRFGEFLPSLFLSSMINVLRDKGPYTVFAPTDEAFRKVPPEILNRIINNAKALEAFVKYHIVERTLCAESIIFHCGVKTMDGSRVMAKCKNDAVYIDNAKIVGPDILATNGVVHAIDEVLIPDAAKNVEELARDLSLNSLLNLTRDAGLSDVLRRDEEFTLFAPTDEAFDDLDPSYLAALRNQPEAMGRLLDYHRVNGIIKTENMAGDKSLDTSLTAKIKITVLRQGIALDNAQIVKRDRTCGNGVIHVINKVLIPPENAIMDMITADPDLSTLKTSIETAGLSSLLTSNGQYTVLAPTNSAFDRMSRRELDKLLQTPDQLNRVLQHHIINRVIVPCAISKSIYSIKSRQAEKINFRRDGANNIVINGGYKAVPHSNIATNGVLYKMDHILPCQCRP